jgi:hypothetical protein
VNPCPGTRKTKTGASIGTSRSPVVPGGLDARVTVLAIEQALEELGIHATLSDIVAKAQSIERVIIQSRCAVRRSKCAD